MIYKVYQANRNSYTTAEKDGSKQFKLVIKQRHKTAGKLKTPLFS